MKPRQILGSVALAIVVAVPAYAAPEGPPSLQKLIDATVADNPILRSSRFEEQASGDDIEAARRRRWPVFSAVAESGASDGPATSAQQPSRAIQVEQTIWDGGRVTALIEQAQAGEARSRHRTTLQMQELSLQLAASWQGYIGAHARAGVARATAARLKEYEAQMQRRVDANASPQIDLELVMSRTRQNDVELSVAYTALRSSALRLEQISGQKSIAARAAGLPPLPDAGDMADALASVVRLDLEAVAAEAAAVQLARDDEAAGRARLALKEAEKWPTAYIRASKPFGGSAERGTNNSPGLFIGLRYTPDGGFSNSVEAQALATRTSALAEATQAARLEALQQLENDREEFISARTRALSLGSAVNGAQQVLESYSRQFVAGRKTWIDLLNAVRELSQNQLALVDAQSAMVGALSRLRIRMGVRAAQGGKA